MSEPTKTIKSETCTYTYLGEGWNTLCGNFEQHAMEICKHCGKKVAEKVEGLDD